MKNRVQATLARHNLQIAGADLFGVASRLELGRRLAELPVRGLLAYEQPIAQAEHQVLLRVDYQRNASHS